MRWLQTRYPADKRAYNNATRQLKAALLKARDEQLQHELARIEVNDESLWTMTKRITKEPHDIPPLHHNSRWYSSPTEKAELFSEILESQFTPNDIHSQIEDRVMEEIGAPLQLSYFKDHFSPAQVKSAIRNSPSRKSPGEDNIIRPLMMHFPRKTIVLLTQIYNSCLRLGYFPSSWKRAVIILIHKPKKPKKDPFSYRPISLLSLFAKILERLLLPRLLNYLGELIPATQFGFRNMHSCVQQLHRVVDNVLNSFEEKNTCVGLFVDTEKAFDKVWHQGLLSKIKNVLPDSYYRIIQSYLADRTFCVRQNGVTSRPRKIVSGVPQGSVLGPLLYLLYTSDMPSSQELISAQFADDAAFLSVSHRGHQSEIVLNSFGERLHKWSSDWKIKLNPQKSCQVIFTYLHNHITPSLNIGLSTVPLSSSVRYLGITLDKRLTFKDHISATVQKCRQRLKTLRHLLTNAALALPCRKLIYLQLIKPIWGYGSQIWGGASASQIRRVQTFQNRALRLITGAPWYVRNSTLHMDLEIPMIEEVLRSSYHRFHERLQHHPNPLAQQICDTHPPTRPHRRLKRKKTHRSPRIKILFSNNTQFLIAVHVE
ncbi:unnamed protein product [Nesidiocoris tenuis]|nr:unnamed protein product [Nesidiocoris tenuis]